MRRHKILFRVFLAHRFVCLGIDCLELLGCHLRMEVSCSVLGKFRA